MRKLAEKTMTATKEVGEAISQIQTGTRKNIANVEHAVKKIDCATELASQSGSSLGEIMNLVELTTDQVRPIAAASEQQSATSEEINRSVEEVAEISTQNAESMVQAANAISDLTKQIQVLQDLIMEMKCDSEISLECPPPGDFGQRMLEMAA